MNREAEIAWAAGLYEGEGGVIWAANARGCRYGRIKIAMTDRDAIERFAVVCGAHQRIVVRKRKIHYKTIYDLEISVQDDVHRILNMFLPYLCERRRADARQVIVAIEHRRESNASKKAMQLSPRTTPEEKRTYSRLSSQKWNAEHPTYQRDYARQRALKARKATQEGVGNSNA